MDMLCCPFRDGCNLKKITVFPVWLIALHWDWTKLFRESNCSNVTLLKVEDGSVNSFSMPKKESLL